MSTKQRLAFLAIDAAQWEVVEDLAERGFLPNCAKILASSTHVPIRGEMAYRAEATWTEALSGFTSDESKYWSTAVFSPSDYTTWEVGAYTGTPFYARPDVSPIVFDVPHSSLAPGVKGVQVTGWGAHSPQYPAASLPTPAICEIDRLFGVHPMTISDGYTAWHNQTFQTNLTEAMLDGIAAKPNIIKWLCGQNPDWDFFMTAFSESHVAGHHFLHGIDDGHPLSKHPSAPAARERFETVFRAIDQAIGEIVAGLPDDTQVVLGSVHGSRLNGGDVTGCVLVPELLHRLHFGRPLIAFPNDVDGPIELDQVQRATGYLQQFLMEQRKPMGASRGAAAKEAVRWNVHTKAPDAVRDRFEAMYRRLEGKPANWWDMELREPVTSPVDVNAETARRTMDAEAPCWYRQYWPEMRFFAVPAFSDCHIRINLEGRERDGKVAAADYDATCDEVEELLRRCLDLDTGRPVVEDVIRPQANDPFDPDGPTADLVVTFNQASEGIEHPKVGRVGRSPFMRSGEHTNEGWLAFEGGTTQKVVSHPYRPRDLGPTFMELLGKSSSPLGSGQSFASEL